MRIVKNIYDLISLLVLYVIFYSVFSEDLIMILGIIVLSLMCISFLGSITATFLFYRAITQEDKQSE